jgi:hypothetical protein
MQGASLMQIRQKVVEAISIAVTGISQNFWVTAKMSSVEERGDTLVIVGTYSTLLENGSYRVTLRKADLSILSYQLS